MTDPARLALGGRLGLAVLSAGAVALALWSMGGPRTGQAEVRDKARMEDLQRLARFVRCVANADEGTLPETLAPDGRCMSAPPLTDRFDGTPYRYEVTSPRGFSLCAGFERTETLRVYGETGRMFDPDTGCLNVTIEAYQRGE
ncbi:hypothetical protein [Pontibaca methylaminivorans]|uniref:Uncharacterized protein n=1 Tax=Pontibaca methylaminivorans TaxID=515897 RepID=A0A1R3X7D3_9RHOB|nr:hypothetical protein [Pontibaca methylaminivorans]SIT86783.1 hypothetical protein SAMN05421849_2416 [Pontibaca methylaminivorans]